jgi:hypothetical protein
MSDFWKDYEPEPVKPAPVTKDEALKLALEALEIMTQPVKTNDETTKYKAVTKAITAIKQALAAPDLQAELDATNRQVEILSDALAESRREVDAMIALARADERDEILRMSGSQWFKSQARYDEAIRARGNT